MDMNSYKLEWYQHTLNLPELRVKIQPNVQIEYEENSLMEPVAETFKAIGKAVAISQIDGPLPIMDTVALGYAILETTKAWHDYLMD